MYTVTLPTKRRRTLFSWLAYSMPPRVNNQKFVGVVVSSLSPLSLSLSLFVPFKSRSSASIFRIDFLLVSLITCIAHASFPPLTRFLNWVLVFVSKSSTETSQNVLFFLFFFVVFWVFLILYPKPITILIGYGG
jgi:TRAP-type C4-dicarboxylate transport system permease large subunit